MSNATSAKSRKASVLAMALGLSMAAALAPPPPQGMTSAQAASETLSAPQQAIVPIAAFAAAGDVPRLGTALNQGGRGSDGERRQGSPRATLRRRRLSAQPQCPRRTDEGAGSAQTARHSGRAGPRAQPRHTEGEALLAAGTANQTKLTGVPVRGPLFDFAPAIDEYLKTHLFGDIFERDNLDWQSRELATVSMLSALPGAERTGNRTRASA